MSEPTWIEDGRRERWQDEVESFVNHTGTTSELVAVLYPEISTTVEQETDDDEDM